MGKIRKELKPIYDNRVDSDGDSDPQLSRG